MIVLNCPHCKKPATYEETKPATLTCSHCSESFTSMGRLPKPDWSIDMGWREYDGPLKISSLPKRACGYCGRACKKNEYACGRCLCDLNQVATVNLKRWMIELDVEPDENVLWAYLALAELDISENEALLRLLRLHPRTARAMGASVDLAERLNYLAPPPRSEAAERVLAKERVEEFEADESWREEAITGSLRGRIAYLFTLGFLFYSVAASIGTVLILLGLGMLVYGGPWMFKFALVPLSVGGGLLWAILPRFDRYPPPGPELTEADHPKLFAVIREMAAKTGQSEPDRVYAVPSVNAFVGTRGGLLGFGGKKIMGLGWPLMQALTISEFKAVLAHEFGHFHGGDTRNAPRIYRIREAIGRIMLRFEDEGGTPFDRPFKWFAEHFLAQSQIVSRRQEYNADALAAQIQGPTALINGLRKLMGVSKAFDEYYSDEIVPILRMRMRVPIAEGFYSFLESEITRERLAEDIDFSQFETDAHPYDTHPPTGYRIKNVSRFPEPATAPENESAITLMGDLALLEQATLSFYYKEHGVLDYPLITWPQAATRFYLPYWQEYLHGKQAHFQDVCLGDLPKLYRDPQALMATWGIDLDDMTQAEMADALMYPFRCGLAIALSRKGWVLRAWPGEPLSLAKDGRTIDLYDLATNVRTDANDALWAELVAGTELAKVKLNDLAAPAKLENEAKLMQLHTRKPPSWSVLPRSDRSKIGWTTLVCWTLAGSVGFLGLAPSLGLADWLIFMPFLVAVALPLRRVYNARRGVGHWLISEDTVNFTANNRTTQIRFADIQQISLRRDTLYRKAEEMGTLWVVHIKAAAGSLYINHYREADRQGALAEEMVHKLCAWRADRWVEELGNGARIRGKGWQVSRDGLQVAGLAQPIPWAELGKPAWIADDIIYHRSGQIEPVLITPHDAPDALTLWQLGHRMAAFEGAVSPLRNYLGSKRRPGGLGFKLLVASAVGGIVFGGLFLGAALNGIDASDHWPWGLLSLGAGIVLAAVAYWIRVTAFIHRHINGLRLGSPFGVKVLCFDDLISSRYTYSNSQPQYTTVWLRSATQALKFTYPNTDDRFIDRLIHQSAEAVACNVFNQIVGGGSWAWTGGLMISEDGITHRRDASFRIPIRHASFENDGDTCLVVHDEREGVYASYEPDRVNGLAGFYLVGLLQDAASKARVGEPPVRRASR